MSATRILNSSLSALLMLFLISCDSDSSIQTPDQIVVNITQISECGGFNNSTQRGEIDIPFTIDPFTYCDTEKLYWLYDENSTVLSLMNTRVLLNCCGDHAITASFEDDVLVITEDDQPPPDGSGRCRCECVFDFFIEVSGISTDVSTFKLDLTVDNTTRTKWEGNIDLEKGIGEIIIDDEALENCDTVT